MSGDVSRPQSHTRDAFLGGQLQLAQPAKGYRAGIDAVMLAASIPAGADDKILELGCGAGVASLCLAHRAGGIKLLGIDIQADLVALARDNAAANGLQDRATFQIANVLAPMPDLRAVGISPDAFNHVFVNPPFYKLENAAAAPDVGKAQAHALSDGTLDDWVRLACVAARAGGTVTFVHRADAAPELLTSMPRWLGAIKIFPLWPKPGAAASRILVQGVKGSRAPFTLRAGLTLHDPDGGFTETAEAILRHGAALDWD